MQMGRRKDLVREREIGLSLAKVFLQTMKPALAFSLAVSLPLALAFLSYAPPSLVVAWLGLLWAVQVPWLIHVGASSSRPVPESAPPLSVLNPIFSGLSSGLYTLALAYVFRETAGYTQVLVGVLFFALYSAGIFFFAMTPMVVISWTLVGGVLVVGNLVTMGQALLVPTILTFVAYLAFLAYIGIARFRVYRERFVFQAEAENQRAELQAILEQSPLSIVVTDLDGKILQTNSRMEELSGYSKEELLGQYPGLLKSGLTPRERYVELWAAISSGQSWHGEFINRNRSGGLYVEKASISPLKDSAGRSRGFIAINEDVTAQREAQERLSRQTEIISLLLHDFETQASDWLWELDDQLRITYVSEKLIALLGSSACLGMPILAFFQSLMPENDPEALALLDGAMAALAAREAFKDVELKVWRIGRMRWISFSAIPVVANEGRPGGWRGVGRDITDKKVMELELFRRANRDERSGLPNRYLFKETMRARLDGLAPSAEGTLGIIRLDGMDMIRTQLGGRVFNAAVLAFAESFYSHLGKDVLIARLGSDEFVFWLDGHDLARIEAIHAFSGAMAAPLKVGGEAYQVDMRMGLAFYPEDGLDLNGLLHGADLALNGAMGLGSRKVMRFQEQLAADFTRRMRLLQALPEALDKGQLYMVYQPQIDSAKGHIVGAEALIRWNHPELGPVSPGEFIPLAEKSGFITRIGEWTLVKACQDAAAWPQDISVSVNVSGAQLHEARRLGHAVGEALKVSGLDPRRLSLEITESAMFNLEETVADSLALLQEGGIQVALDDFGTGYSSLTYLQKLTFNKLKIDQSFIRPLGSDAEAEKLVLVVMELAQAYSLWTVAEGVETEAQAEFLARHGCDWLQGFLYGRGMPQDEFLAYIKKRA